MDRETEATLADKGITQGPTQKDNRLSAIRSAASRKTLLRDVCGLRRPWQIPFLGIIDFRIAYGSLLHNRLYILQSAECNYVTVK